MSEFPVGCYKFKNRKEGKMVASSFYVDSLPLSFYLRRTEAQQLVIIVVLAFTGVVGVLKTGEKVKLGDTKQNVL